METRFLKEDSLLGLRVKVSWEKYLYLDDRKKEKVHILKNFFKYKRYFCKKLYDIKLYDKKSYMIKCYTIKSYIINSYDKTNHFSPCIIIIPKTIVKRYVVNESAYPEYVQWYIIYAMVRSFNKCGF